MTGKWTLERNYMDYADPENYSGLRDVEGTFEGVFDPTVFGDTLAGPQQIYLYVDRQPAWWGRLKHRLLGTDPGSYVYADGTGTVDYTADGLIVEGTMKFDEGVVTLHPQPMSRLEHIWHRFCTRIGR
jgi:hypothetical protein